MKRRRASSTQGFTVGVIVDAVALFMVQITVRVLRVPALVNRGFEGEKGVLSVLYPTLVFGNALRTW